ncbi:MAG: hypothetical protein EGP77_00120 [Lachnospiraceae bacterium]|nr:hypothetical protein [Lachnospiraceae bacterium]
MEKKNPYIMTIGFKKEDPDHVYVAEFLNSLGRGKAQYIVKAVLAYQNGKQNGEILQPAENPFDYDTIKQIVLQVMEERERQTGNVIGTVQEIESEKENDLLQGFDEDALTGIVESLQAFQEQ